MHAVHGARITLLATLLNMLVRSSFTVGVAAPIAAAFFYNHAALRAVSVGMGACFWIIIASVLHLFAQRVLGKPRP